jgi:hypothetical protein
MIEEMSLTENMQFNTSELQISLLVSFTEVMAMYGALIKDDSIFLNSNFQKYMTLLTTFEFGPTISLTENMKFNTIDLNEAQASTYTDSVAFSSDVVKQSKSFFKDAFELVQLL